MTRALPALALALSGLALPGLVLAGRPLNTEDASTLGDKACQVESWVDRTRGSVTDFSFVPACALFGVEWQAGAVRTRAAGRSATSATFVQGKHAFRSVDEGAWGIGLVAGLNRDLLGADRKGWGDPYILVPLSFGVGEDKEARGLVHLNLGAARIRGEARNLTLWGVAFEKPVSDRLTVLAEAFGEDAAKPFVRSGGRFTVFAGLDLDFTYVTRAGGARQERFWSLGFHWEPGSFLPSRHAARLPERPRRPQVVFAPHRSGARPARSPRRFRLQPCAPGAGRAGELPRGHDTRRKTMDAQSLERGLRRL